MTVNGKPIELLEETSLEKFVSNYGYVGGKIAVEINGFVIAKGAYETKMLSNEDSLEIVSFVGGG